MSSTNKDEVLALLDSARMASRTTASGAATVPLGMDHGMTGLTANVGSRGYTNRHGCSSSKSAGHRTRHGATVRSRA